MNMSLLLKPTYGGMTVNPDPLLLTLCSQSIHECVNPWDLLETQLSNIDSLTPAVSLFVL